MQRVRERINHEKNIATIAKENKFFKEFSDNASNKSAISGVEIK